MSRHIVPSNVHIQYTGKQLRLSKHYTVREFATLVGVSPSTISKWESGVCIPDIYTLFCASNVLQASLMDLLEIQESIK